MARAATALAALIAIFAIAFGVGRAIGDGQPGTGPDPATERHGSHADVGADEGSDPVTDVHGLGVAENGLRLLAPSTVRAGAAAPFRFRVVDDGGATVRDFDVEHTKRLHLIAVRRDLTGFQHLHPEQDATGAWSTALRLRDPGAYRVFADFTPSGGAATTLATDVSVGGDFQPVELPAAARHVAVDGYDVALRTSGGQDTTLRFTVSRDGRPVAVQPYLGAAAHLVALREGDLAYLHVHPLAGQGIAFAARYPSAGRYRLFLQFQVDGRVHTAALTQAVAS